MSLIQVSALHLHMKAVTIIFLKMSVFRSIRTGNWVLQAEMEGGKRRSSSS